MLPGSEVDVVVPTELLPGPEDDDLDADAGAGTRVVPGSDVVTVVVVLVVVTGDVVVVDLDSIRIPLFGSCMKINGWLELV